MLKVIMRSFVVRAVVKAFVVPVSAGQVEVDVHTMVAHLAAAHPQQREDDAEADAKTKNLMSGAWLSGEW